MPQGDRPGVTQVDGEGLQKWEEADCSSQHFFPDSSPKFTQSAAYCFLLQGPHGGVWSVLSAVLARSCVRIIWCLSSPCHCPEPARERAGTRCCEPRGGRHLGSASGKRTKLDAASSGDFLRLVLGKAGGGQHKENRPSCGVSARRRIQMSQLGNFPSEAPCKTQSALPCSCGRVRCQSERLPKNGLIQGGGRFRSY